MWMIKIMIKTNEINMDVLLISKVDDIKNHVCPLSPACSIILLALVTKKFIETYLPLVTTERWHWI